MKFKLYDILSHLIPGFIAYGLISVVYKGVPENLKLLPELAIAFVLGYFINTLSSWLEEFYFWTWGGKPSSRLLDGKYAWKVKFQEWEKAKNYLKKESGSENANNDSLFSIARRYANNSTNTRIQDFNSNYAFSRAVLTAILVCFFVVLYQNYANPFFYLISIPLLLISWLRSKQRGYYYAREVLDTYLDIKEKEKGEN